MNPARKKGASRRRGSVGVVGLGIMGGAFAKNLVEAGWRVVGYDIDPQRNRAIARLGVEITSNAGELAAKVPTIITSLPSARALDATVRAIVAAQVPRRVLIEASTLALDDKFRAERTLRKAGHVALDSPVSGTGSQARIGDLVFYASGDRKAIARVRPLFAAFSRKTYDVGPFGNGSRMKYVANLLVAVNNVATAEAMVLGMKAGLDPQTIFEMVSGGAGNSRVFELRAPLMVKNRYDDPTMKVSIWQKDMAVIGEFARQIKSPTPMFDATIGVYNRAMKTGHAEHDTAAVCAVLEKMAGLKRGKAASRANRR